MKKIALTALLILVVACSKVPVEELKGGIFLSENLSSVEYDDVKVEDSNGNIVFQDDFSSLKNEWGKNKEWEIINGVAKLDSLKKSDSRLAIYSKEWEAFTITVKGKKVLGNDGLYLGFSAKDENSYYEFIVGGFGNTRTVLKKSGVDGGVVAECKESDFESLPTDQVVELKVELKGNKIKCYVDNKLLISYKINENNKSIKSDEFLNPIDSEEQHPDPFVYKHSDGYYYGMHTVMDDKGYTPKVVLYRNKTLSDLYTKGQMKYIFETPKGQGKWNSADVWAPEIYNLDGVWYIYYSLSNFRVGVLSNKNANPLEGQWKDEGRIFEKESWAIDASIFKQNGKGYILWSGIPSEGMQRIYIQQMASPTKLVGEKLELSKPEYDWERQGTAEVHDVNEGPIVLQRNGKTFVVYSASFCVTEHYKLGMLTIDDNKDPMIKENWTKSDKPVFQKSEKNRIYGPGHNGFTVSPDGKEDWIIYHALMNKDVGGNRLLMMQKFEWNKDGTPNFGIPQGRNKPLKKPSGE